MIPKQNKPSTHPFISLCPLCSPSLPHNICILCSKTLLGSPMWAKTLTKLATQDSKEILPSDSSLVFPETPILQICHDNYHYNDSKTISASNSSLPSMRIRVSFQTPSSSQSPLIDSDLEWCLSSPVLRSAPMGNAPFSIALLPVASHGWIHPVRFIGQLPSAHTGSCQIGPEGIRVHTALKFVPCPGNIVL